MVIRRTFPYLATLAHSLSIALPQVLGLVYLGPAEYGSYSLLYLGYALGGSCVLSVVCEAWVRSGSTESSLAYLRTGSLLALVFALGTAALGVVVGVSAAAAVMAGAGVYFATVWASGRYLVTAQGAWGKLLLAEVSGLSVAGVAFGAAIWLTDVGLVSVLTIWAASAAGAVIVSGVIARPSVVELKRWVATHRRHIRTLLSDSILLDASSIGVPFLLYPLLGAASFGKYRAISSVAFPIRLVMAAVRPMLSGLSVTLFKSIRVQSLIVAAGVVLGMLAALCVWLIARQVPDLGTIAAIGQYSPHVGVFVAATTQSTAVYLYCRIRSSAKNLLAGRFLQTIIMVACPLAGFFAGGEAGAVTGFVLGAVINSAIWHWVLTRIEPAA